MTQLVQLSQPTAETVAVRLNTNYGAINLALFPEYAPKTVENFLGLAQKGYYNGVIFHRVIDNFMIQGGDPTGTGMGGESLWGGKFEDEFSRELFHIQDALAIANAGPNTNGSQFFIVSAKEVPQTMLSQLEAGGWPQAAIEAYRERGGTPWLDHRHTVFGQVTDGQEVVQRIEQVAKNHQDRPLEDVVIESIDVL